MMVLVVDGRIDLENEGPPLQGRWDRSWGSGVAGLVTLLVIGVIYVRTLRETNSRVVSYDTSYKYLLSATSLQVGVSRSRSLV